MQFVKPTPYYEALDKIGGRSPIGSAMLSSEWSDVPVALRERAFFSSEVESVRFLQRARDMIGDFISGARETLPDGSTALKVGSRADFIAQARAFALSEGLGPLDPADAGGLKDITSEKRLGLIFDVQTTQMESYGYYRQGMDPDVLNEFPAMRFIRVQDVKEPRELHVPYEDQVYLKTDPIWSRVINKDFGVPWAPFGWGCGHDTEDVDRDEAESLGLVKSGERIEPDVKGLNENLKASASGLDPDLLEKLQADLGPQLVIDTANDELRWKPQVPPALPANVAPVSEAVEVTVPGYTRELVNAGLSAIDRVHDDGVLPGIELKESKGPEYGFLKLKATAAGVGTDFAAVNPASPWRSLTAVHEMGHFLDAEAIGRQAAQGPALAFKDLATRRGDPEMAKVLAAAEKTDAIKKLRRQQQSQPSRGKYLGYLLSPEEIWARAYAQFIAERSGFIVLRDDLARALATGASNGIVLQWETDDFKPVAEAIEGMFRKAGWMK